MDIYNNNIQSLKKYRTQFYKDKIDEIEEYDYDETICRFETARNGLLYMEYCRDDKTIRLNSNYNPDKEAEKWAAQYEYKNFHNVTVMFGLGTGIFVRELIKRNTSSDIIVICEPDIRVFVNILHRIDMIDLIRNEQVIIVVGKDFDRELFNALAAVAHWSNIEFMKQLQHPGYAEFMPEEYKVYEKSVEDVMLAITSQGLTEEEFGVDITSNIISNIKYVIGSSYVRDFQNAFEEDVPAIVVAAGPSLDKNIGLLKEVKNKAVIFAVDTALKRLHEEGIRADFTITVDPRKPISYFDDTGFEDIPMFCRLDCNPKILSRHTARKIWFNPVEFHEKIMEYAGVPFAIMSSGGSVATATVTLCNEIGFKTIIIMGQDLAYASDGLTHAGGKDDKRPEKLELYVKGNYEEKVHTRSDWFIFLRWYERFIKYGTENVRFINATEGGAYIEGTEVMTLREAIDECCKKDEGIDDIIKEVLNKDHSDIDNKSKEFLANSLNNFRLMKKGFEKGISLCNRFERKYSKSKQFTPEVTKCMADIKKTSKRLSTMPEYQMIDSIIKHKDARSLVRIYENNEDSEYMNNINMINNTKHIYELGLESLNEIYDEFNNTIKEILDEK
jgi:hypothetical protein